MALTASLASWLRNMESAGPAGSTTDAIRQRDPRWGYIQIQKATPQISGVRPGTSWAFATLTGTALRPHRGARPFWEQGSETPRAVNPAHCRDECCCDPPPLASHGMQVVRRSSVAFCPPVGMVSRSRQRLNRLVPGQLMSNELSSLFPCDNGQGTVLRSPLVSWAVSLGRFHLAFPAVSSAYEAGSPGCLGSPPGAQAHDFDCRRPPDPGVDPDPMR